MDWSGVTPDSKLDVESFVSEFNYDAINRITRQTAPDGSIFETTFNEANLLEKVRVTQSGTPEFFVNNVDYNEKGQRTRILYGNNVSTEYFYDKETFGLIRLLTKRANNDPLQDLHYTFDPVGNVTHLEDKNIPAVFFDNTKITGLASYTYDALYRLIEATGREHVATPVFGVLDNWNDQPFIEQRSAGDAMTWRNYTQQYDYDAVGNIGEMRHVATGGNWTRTYAYPANGNRLQSSTVGADIYNYSYHPRHGFITAMPHLQVMKWNFKDELQAVARQSVLSGTPETTWYVYDGGGQRVRKVTDNQAAAGVDPSRKAERIYVGGIEVYREFSGGGGIDLERKTCHVMDDKSRVAMIETRTAGIDPAPPRLVRYQFANHLGSACIETDATARVISYEEYHPFGTTSYQANDQDIKAAAKRYRYTAMERDEESGLEYHSARYYLPWLARWISPDPKGMVDGPNLYRYARNNPVRLNDPNGMDPPDPPDPPPSAPRFDIGPYRFSNFRDVDASGLFSDISIPEFNLTGPGMRLNLDQLSIDDDRLRVGITGKSQIKFGPADLLHLDLDARANATTRIDQPFSNWWQPFDNSAFSGDARITARLALGPAVGFISLDANTSDGEAGDLSAMGYVRLGPYHLLDASGKGGVADDRYRISGNFHGNFPLLTIGTWSFSSAEGFSASGHYVGPQFGPFGLNVGINPLETGEGPESRRPAGGSIMMFEPGMSVGYTYFHYGTRGSFVFSAGFSFDSSNVEYSREQPRIPLVSDLPKVGDAVEKALYGRTLSTSMGPYAGVRLGWTF